MKSTRLLIVPLLTICLVGSARASAPSPTVCVRDNYRITLPTGWTHSGCVRGAGARAPQDRVTFGIVAGAPIGLGTGSTVTPAMRGTLRINGVLFRTVTAPIRLSGHTGTLTLLDTLHQGKDYALVTYVEAHPHAASMGEQRQLRAAVLSFRFLR